MGPNHSLGLWGGGNPLSLCCIGRKGEDQHRSLAEAVQGHNETRPSRVREETRGDDVLQPACLRYSPRMSLRIQDEDRGISETLASPVREKNWGSCLPTLRYGIQNQNPEPNEKTDDSAPPEQYLRKKECGSGPLHQDGREDSRGHG